MAKKMISKFKYKCLTCGTEIYSDEPIGHCSACGADEIKKFKSTDITCPNDSGFTEQVNKKFKDFLVKAAIVALIGSAVAGAICMMF